jgi:ubiquinone/menaquinone biosynthesis C-methylase UbiE
VFLPVTSRKDGHTKEVLQELGIAEGHRVLDCCCGSGTYSIAAAELVGESGSVYAIDNNARKLGELSQKIDLRGLKNIQVMEEDVDFTIPLADSAVDFVLLYDIFWYFRPGEDRTHGLLRTVRRVAKPGALISVYPTHVDSEQLRWFKDDMSNCGFILVSQFSRKLVHEENLETGTLLNYRTAQDHPLKVIERNSSMRMR